MNATLRLSSSKFSRSPHGSTLHLLSPREEKFLRAGSSLALSRRRTRLFASGRALGVFPYSPSSGSGWYLLRLPGALSRDAS